MFQSSTAYFGWLHSLEFKPARARRMLTTLPKRTYRAREHAGLTLHTNVIITRLSHVDVNGNCIWYIATPHGVFRTVATAWAVNMSNFRGGAVLSIDHRGSVYGLQPLEMERDRHHGYVNWHTWQAMAIAVNTDEIYFRARAGMMDQVSLAESVTRAMDDAPAALHISWDEVIEALLRD